MSFFIQHHPFVSVLLSFILGQFVTVFALGLAASARRSNTSGADFVGELSDDAESAVLIDHWDPSAEERSANQPSQAAAQSGDHARNRSA